MRAHGAFCRAAAIYGQTFRRTGALAVLGKPSGSPEAETWLSALVKAELILPRENDHLRDDQEYGFRHALVRDAAYGLLTASDLRTGHRLAGQWLEARGTGDAWVLATHFELGGRPTQALAWFHRAAEQALPGGDTDRVIACATRGSACSGAIGAEPSGSGSASTSTREVHAALRALEGEARAWRGELALAETCSLEALHGLERGSPVWYQTAFGALLASTQLGNFERIGDYIELLVAEEPRKDAAAPEARAWFFVVRLMVTVGDVATAQLFRQRLEQLEARIRDDSCAIPWVHCARGYWSTYVEYDPALALASYLAELPHFERTGDIMNHRITRAHIGWVLLWLGAFEESERTLAAVVAEPDAAGFILDFSRLHLGRALALLGRHDEARALEQNVCASFVSAKNFVFAGLAHAHIAEIEALAGNAEAAASSAASAAEMLKTAPPMRASALGWAARSRLALGDAAGALVLAQEGVAVADALGVSFEGEIRLLLALAEALVQSDRRDEATAALRRARERIEAAAGGIGDPEQRRRFLERIPENARVLAVSRELSSDASARS